MSNIVKVDGWVIEEHEGAWSVRDVELAEKVGLAKPRNIRAVIANAIEDGALKNGALGAGAVDEPSFWLEEVHSVSGNNKVEVTTAYRLNRAAALLICTRLRTKRSVDITLAIVKVFDAVLSGKVALAPPAPPAAEPPPAIAMPAERRAELLLECVRLMSPAVSAEAKDAVLAHAAAALTGGSAVPLLPKMPAPRWMSPTQIAEAANRTATAVGRSISKLGLRGGPHSKAVMNTKMHSEGQVVTYLYDPQAVEKIIADLNAGPAAVPMGGV